MVRFRLETDLVRRPRVRGTAPQATVGMERQLFHPYLSRSERRWLSRAVVRSRCETPKMDGSFPDVPPFTWLILPVVICLSQRLSHASVSTSTHVKRNCEWLIKSVVVHLIVPVTRITVAILELIHAKSADCFGGMRAFIRPKTDLLRQ